MAVITMSRQVAALGDEVSAAVAKKLDYKFIDRKEIERRIIALGFPADKLNKYDERKPGFFASLAKDRDEYLDYLQTVIYGAAAEGNCILIGRGASFVLEELPNLVSFRFVANDSIRIQRLQKEFDWNEKQAQDRIDESAANRAGFHKSFFNINHEDASLYHMVINTGILNVEDASNIIVSVVNNYITPEKESAGALKIKELLLAQNLVNTLVFKHSMNINFLHAVVVGNRIMLHGVADSNAIVEKAVIISSKLYPEYKIESSISVVQDFRPYQ